MRRVKTSLLTALLLAGLCAGEPPRSAPPQDAPRVFTGKVLAPASPKDKAADRGLNLVAGDGTTYPLVEDSGSKMLFLDRRLQNRPVRLTAQVVPGGKNLRVVLVQTVKDGKVYNVDYWCETCRISMSHPGSCYCCGEEVEFRERPVE